MAVSFVANHGATAGSTGTLNFGISGAVANGNILIITVSSKGGTVGTVALGGSSVGVTLVGSYTTNGTDVWVYRLISDGSSRFNGASTLAATFSGGTACTLSACSFSGQHATTPVDQVVTAGGASGAGTKSTWASGDLWFMASTSAAKQTYPGTNGTVVNQQSGGSGNPNNWNSTTTSYGSTSSYNYSTVSDGGTVNFRIAQAPATPPAAPTGVAASRNAANPTTAVTVSWTDASSNETGFRVERSTASDFTVGLSSQTVGAGVQSAVVSGLTPGTLYYFRVYAYNGAGDSPASNTASRRLGVPMSGTVAATSTVPTADMSELVRFTGTIAASSGAQGAVAGVVDFTGTIAATSATEGDMQAQGVADFSGTVAAASGAQGAAVGVVDFNGIVASTSGGSGDMTLDTGGGSELPAYHAYNFDENTGSTSADYGTDGTAATVNEWTAPGYDGSTSAISSGANTAGGTVVIPADPDNWTLMCWVRTRNSSGYSSIMESPNSDLWFEMNGFSLEPYTSGVGYSLAGGTLSSNVWTHVALIGEAGVGTRVLLNGVTQDSDSAVHPLSAGTYQISGSSSQTGDMDVDDFRYVQAALSDAEVQTYMATPPGSGGGSETLPFSGTVAATSGASGLMTLEGVNAMNGTVASASDAEGDMVAVLPFSGTVAATSGAGGNLINPDAPPWMASISGRAVLDQRGDPYYANVYTLWNLVAYAGAYDETGVGTTTPATVFEAVCAELEANGYNGVQVLSVSSSNNGERGPYADGRTWDGVAPWGAGGIGDLNEAYWSRVDDLVEIAAAHGITVWFFITSGYALASGGAFASLNTTNGATLGTALGNRYKNNPNIIWCHGSDYFGFEDTEIGAIQTAIEATGDTHLLTMIYYPESSSTIDSSDSPPGSPPATLDLSFVYSYNGAGLEVRRAWADTSLPLYHGDGYYYQEGTSSTQNVLQLMSDLRGWALTSGSRGFYFGSEGTWAGDSAGQYDDIFTETWPDNHVSAFTAAWTALDGWEELAPDLSSTFVTSSRGTDMTAIPPGGGNGEYNLADSQNNYLGAAITPDGRLGVLYTPTSRTGITVNTALLPTNYSVRWLDPFDGSSVPQSIAASYSTPGTNSEGFSGWYLVFEVADPPLSGTVGGASGTEGAMTATLPFSGTVAAASDVEGSMSVTLDLSGTVAAASGAQGEMSVTLDLSGTVATTSGVEGDMGTQSVAELSGTIAATSGANGDLTELVSFSGQVDATSGAQGEMTETAAFSGTVAATSGASGLMTLEGVNALNGRAQAVSGAEGDMTTVVPMSGTVAATSGASGDMGQSSPVPFSGQVYATSGSSGAMNIEGVTPLEGSVVATSGASGDMGIVVPFSGTIAATSGAQGSTSETVPFSGTVSAISGAQGDMTKEGLIALSGTVASTSGASAEFSAVSTGWGGTVVAVSGASGRMWLSGVPTTPHPDRFFVVDGEDRTFTVVDEDRIFTVPADDRTFLAPDTDRTV